MRRVCLVGGIFNPKIHIRAIEPLLYQQNEEQTNTKMQNQKKQSENDRAVSEVIFHLLIQSFISSSTWYSLGVSLDDYQS